MIGTTCSQVVFCGQPGVYGTLGTSSAGNIPGGRYSASSWTDSSGNLWLFGGVGFDSNGAEFFLNDVWRFSPSTNEWTWMGGSNTINQSGVYGTLGTPAAGNIPGARRDAVSWIDSSGHFWLFGGWGMDGSGSYSALNDLWEFNPSTNQWAWMSGSNSVDQPSVNGTLGTPSPGNNPGGLYAGTSWTDNNGHLWLLGGYGYPANGVLGYPDDLWEFDTSLGEWTWVDGSSTPGSICANGNFCGPAGVYGTLGAPAAGNMPGSRSGAMSWTDASGSFWLFFGIGYYTNGDFDQLNDVWRFSPSTSQWAWMGGSSTCAVQGYCANPGVYGTLGSAAPGNLPGSRDTSSTWTDNSGHLWLFGGEGRDVSDNQGLLNDLWEFNSSTNEWAWMGGSNSIGVIQNPTPNGKPGVYGTLGTPSPSNIPGARMGASTWTDKSGNLWMFGGYGFDANDKVGYLNDLWEYQPGTPLPAAATPTFSVPAGTYSTAQAVEIGDSTAGATIYYTTNGTTPTTSSTVYAGPIAVSSTDTIEAIATASGYSSSTIASATYTIPENFTLSLNPTSISVHAGQSGTSTITVQDLGGFNSNILFVCSGLPAGAACSFSLETVPTPAGISYTTLTISTSSAAAALSRHERALFPETALALVLYCFGFRKRKRLQVLLLLAVSAAGLSLLNGCSNSVTSPSSPVTSTITVTATSGTLENTITLVLTVN